MAFKRSRTVLKTFTLKSYHISPIPKMAAVEIRTWGTSTFFMIYDIILISKYSIQMFNTSGLCHASRLWHSTCGLRCLFFAEYGLELFAFVINPDQ